MNAHQVVSKRKDVTVPLDYFVFLHDQLAANEAELKEILGDPGKKVIFDRSSERLARGTERPLSAHPIDGAIERIEGWGVKVTRNKDAGSVRVHVDCPYAEVVHPLRSKEHPVCPLGEYLLGALRLEDKNAQLVRNSLLADGAEFEITTSDSS
jgi:hypothetical protein